jgi:hypothetical protein
MANKYTNCQSSSSVRCCTRHSQMPEQTPKASSRHTTLTYEAFNALRDPFPINALRLAFEAPATLSVFRCWLVAKLSTEKSVGIALLLKNLKSLKLAIYHGRSILVRQSNYLFKEPSDDVRSERR